MTIQKFTTFDDLKSIENKITKNDALSLKKHGDFEKVIMNIRSVKVQQDKLIKPKP